MRTLYMTADAGPLGDVYEQCRRHTSASGAVQANSVKHVDDADARLGSGSL